MNASANLPLPLGEINRVMVIKLRQLGDVVLSTPVLRSLRKNLPAARLAACVNPGTAEALVGDPLVDEVIVTRRMRGLGGWRDCFSYLRAFHRFRPDLVIDLTVNDRAVFLTGLSCAKWSVAYRKPKGSSLKSRFYTHIAKPNPKDHMVQQHLEALRVVGMASEDTSLSFPVSTADREAVAALVGSSNPIVHVHPVSRLEAKCWPDAYMATLLDLLGHRGLTPVLSASLAPAERDRVRRILALARVPCIDLSGKITVRQLGALSERAKLFLGVDSAPMHIAAAVGVPVIALFGPSSEYLWHPWCKQHLVLSQSLPCRLPCKGKQTCTTYECLATLTPERVIPKVQAFLDEVL